ncbi:GNAT family N-acetyltransferase [Escherichia albertii]|uniref:GNAT family N-acetyltransferase n=1 Tax=Escherichia albertii TaxID=208962 RepID=A0A5A4U9C9_ESCAL|nr:GNAT family N-acetyltransferase [Escherichia albertii]MCZ9036178.1 GNAT family N-acetyltransferase [Escherichia albertii]BBM63182.1 GNAT family N-acetyltransferase [Escherichia albertii]
MELTVTINSATEELINRLRTFYSHGYESNNRLLKKGYLEWLLNENPAGQGKVIMVSSDEEILSSMLVIPLRLQTQNKIKEGYFITDVLSHPSHRDKNLFVKMIRFLVEKVKKDNGFIIGHPNRLAIPGWKRTKMNFQVSLKNIIYFPKPKSLLLVRKKKVHNISELENIDKTLRNIASSQLEPKVLADSKFLLWRYMNNPCKKYRILTYYIKGKFIGLTVEFKTRNNISKICHSDIIPGYESLVYTSSILPKIYVLPEGLVAKGGYELRDKRVVYFFTDYDEYDFSDRGDYLTLASSDI